MFSKEDIIYDVLIENKEIEKIFKEFGIRCFGWGGALFKSIGNACEIYNVNCDELLNEINKKRWNW